MCLYILFFFLFLSFSLFFLFVIKMLIQSFIFTSLFTASIASLCKLYLIVVVRFSYIYNQKHQEPVLNTQEIHFAQ